MNGWMLEFHHEGGTVLYFRGCKDQTGNPMWGYSADAGAKYATRQDALQARRNFNLPEAVVAFEYEWTCP